MFLLRWILFWVASKQADTACVNLFSEKNGEHVRRLIEDYWVKKAPKIMKSRWGKKFRTDNQFFLFLGAVFKSNRLKRCVKD